MRKVVTWLVVLVFVVSVFGCITGPFQLSRSVDDFHNDLYAKQPILAAVLSPFLWTGYWIAGVVDEIVVNNYYFWGHDVWAGKGTAYKHTDAENPRALLGNVFKGGKFMQVTK